MTMHSVAAVPIHTWPTTAVDVAQGKAAQAALAIEPFPSPPPPESQPDATNSATPPASPAPSAAEIASVSRTDSGNHFDSRFVLPPLARQQRASPSPRTRLRIIFRHRGLQQVVRKREPQVKHSLRSQRFRRLKRPIPIKVHLPLDEFRYIRDPGYSFPKILRAVDTKRGQEIFRRQRRHFAPGNHHLNHPLSEPVDIRSNRKMSQRQFRMEFDNHPALFVAIVVFPRAPAPFSNPLTESKEIALDSRVPASPRALSANRVAAK